MSAESNAGSTYELRGKLSGVFSNIIDNTLSIEGAGADAKATGDAISEVSADLTAHVSDRNNPHGVTAEQVGARPNTWTPTALEVGARPNTWLPNIAEIGAAPAGYGLGSGAIEVTDWNDAILNGWYKSADSGEVFNSPFPEMGCWGYTVAHNATDGIVQVAFTYTSPDWTTNGLFQKIRFYKDTIGWSDWEWVNPPMIEGEDYRTAERWNGKTVFATAFSIGNLPNASYKNITFPAYIANFASAIVSVVVVTDSGAYINVVDSATTLGAYVKTDSDYSSQTAKLIVKYVCG